MKKIILSVLMCCVAIMASAQIERPKLVVGLVVDQMRWDYLYYYYDKYGEGGMKRLLSEGFSCENQMLTYVRTVLSEILSFEDSLGNAECGSCLLSQAWAMQASILVRGLPPTASPQTTSTSTASASIAATTLT